MTISGADRRPVIFLAFANDRDDRVRYLRNLAEETRCVLERLDAADPQKICEVVVRNNTTVRELLDVFMDPRYRNRIAVFHFGGHAGGYQLLLESAEGRPEFAHAAGLAEFLGHQRGLQLVFLNGCSTEPQVEGLLQSGIPAVIATSEAIDDAAATELSIRFYAAVAGGAPIGTAYAEAAASVKTLKGDSTRNVFRDVYRVDPAISDRWPWDLFVREGAEVVREWSLPKAAGDSLFGLPPLPEQDLPETPYRHLQWFREEDAELFFGRGREIRAFYELVISPSAAPLVLFYGQSGVGKSSMLAAGLLPRLASSHQVRYARRQRELGLTETMMTALGVHGQDATLAAAWHAMEAKADKPLVVILDQVEEVYTRPHTGDADELDDFVRALSEAFADRSGRPRGKLVLGFRKEWLADLEERLRESKIPRSKSYLERLDRHGIIEIVEGPVRSERLRQQFNIVIEPGLAELIADNLLEDREAPIAPTLEVLLTKMWKQAKARNRDAPKFATELYQDLRSKGLLLDDFVDEQLNALHDSNTSVVDTGLALDLLAFHTTSLGTAESRTRAEVDAAYLHQEGALQGLLQQCKDLYLLVDHTPPGQVEGHRAEGTRLAHDTLAPLVRRRFKDSDMPGQRARRILENRAGEWRDGSKGNPLDESDLATVEQGKAGMSVWTSDEQRLVQASRSQRRYRRWVRGGTAALGIAALILIIGLYISARASEKQAVSRALAATAKNEPQLELALLLSVEATRAAATFEARDALLSSLLRPVPLLRSHMRINGGVSALAFSTDGTSLASGGPDGLWLWNLTGRRAIGDSLAGGGSVSAVAFSPDGTTLATGSVDGKLRLWNIKSRGYVGNPLGEHLQRVDGVAFSPDGTTLASGSWDGTVRLWDVKTAEQIGKPLGEHLGRVFGVAFSPRHGAILAAASKDGTLRLWDVTDARSPRPIGLPLREHRGQVKSLAFSPDGATLASGSEQGTLSLWDLRNVKQAHVTGGPIADGQGQIYGVAFSPDGATLASGSSDGSLRLWDVKSRQATGELLARSTRAVLVVGFSHDGTTLISGAADGMRVWDVKNRPSIGDGPAGQIEVVRSVAFSPDSVFVASGNEDGTILLWDARDVKRPQPLGSPLAAHKKPVSRVVFSPDGLTLASGAFDGVLLWDMKRRPLVGVPLGGQTRGVRNVAFSPDGATLALATLGGLRLWDVRSGQPLVDFKVGAVSGVAFSPDGATLASSGEDGTLRLWNMRDMNRPRAIGSPLAERTAVSSMMFSPDGETLASGNSDGIVSLWDVRDLTNPRPIELLLARHTGKVAEVVFSPDGTMLASAGLDSTIILWDVATRQPLGPPFRNQFGVAFSPDGAILASGGADGLHLWEANQLAWARSACTLAGRNLGGQEWNWFLPRRGYKCTCPAFPSVNRGKCRGS